MEKSGAVCAATVVEVTSAHPMTHRRTRISTPSRSVQRRTHAVPLEVGHLIGEAVDVRIVAAQHERLDELLEHPDLQMCDEIGRQRRAYQPELLKPAKAIGEVRVGGLPQLGDATVKARI